MSKNRLVLVDGMSILHRAYHGYPLSLKTSSGEITNAVYGFTSILLNVLGKIEPTHVVVAWDVGKPTFRHKEFDGYKASREKPDAELIAQIDRTKEVVEAFNIPQFGVEGFEADDVIGTLSKQASAGKDEVIIVTGDRDALQLVKGDQVKVWMPPATGKYAKDKGPQIYDEEAVMRKYEMTPDQLIDLKALMGDASDDIPGIKGVGSVTATKLIKAFVSLDGIYEALKKDREKVVEVVGARFTGMLENGKEDAYLSQKLGRIYLDVPVKLSWKECKLSDYNRKAVLKLFDDLEFRSLEKRLPKDGWEEELEGVFG